MPKHKEDVSSADVMKGKKISQAAFARIIGVDRSVVCRLLEKEILGPEASGHVWLIQYIAYTKGIAAGRSGSGF